MSDVQEQVENSTAAKLARLERLCGGFPVLSSENRQDYEELLISLLEHHTPRNFLGERLIKYLADEEWEIGRYKRHKVLLMERRFRARLAFQAYREKATQQDKAALDKKLAEQSPGQLILPEEALDGVIADIDAMLRRPAEELDHARALEVGMVYFEHLDRLLNAAIVRRNAILSDIERYDYLFDPRLPVSAWAEQMEDGRDRHANESEIAGAKLDEAAPAIARSQEVNRELAGKSRGQSGQRSKEPWTAHRDWQIEVEPQCLAAWARRRDPEPSREV